MQSVRRSKRKNNFTQERDGSGKFKRTCGAITHNPFNDENQSLIDLRKRPKMKNTDYHALIESGIVTTETSFICQACFDNFKKPELNSLGEEELINSDIEDNVEDDLTLRCIEIGQDLKQFIYPDINNMESIKSIGEIKSYNSRKWLTQRPAPLLHLLCSICGIDINTASDKKLIIISKIIELIYCCTNGRKVLPNHFLENLLCYSFTNCKSYLSFLGNRSSGGSYSYITQWLKDQSKTPIAYPNGMVKSVFDNSQKVGKTYLISETNVVKTSVITSHLWITLDSASKLQEQQKYQPANWMWEKVSNSTQSNIIDYLTKPQNIFRETRDKFIDSCLSIVYDEHKKLLTDYIDLQIKEELIANSLKKCVLCGCEADISLRKCRNCGGSVTKETYAPDLSKSVQVNPYDTFQGFSSSLPNISCKAGEPDFLNPNGYHSIIQVIQTIGLRSGIKQYGNGSREWLFVECDGLPYNIIRDIIANVWRCTQCLNCYYGLSNFNDHKCYVLSKVVPKREFSWLLPICGLLHLEMNAARSYTKRNWEVFSSCLGTVLGFKSPKAQAYLQKGADHHKLWHFLEILYSSISLELMVPYVRDCISNGNLPNANGYWNWSDGICDPNYLYMQESVLTYLHGLMMFRSGVRKCNAELVKNAIGKISHLFYAGNHPTYQNILFQDTRDKHLMPSELKDVMEQFITGSKTGTIGKCEGGDAMLEELNKDSKSWLKMAGIPSNEQWLHVFRNIDDLTEIKNTALKSEKSGKEKKPAEVNEIYKRSNKVQINKVRNYVRGSKYLLDPFTQREHRSIDTKTTMSEDLVNFPAIAMDNTAKYVKAKLQGEVLKLTPVFVTKKEEQEFFSLENRTIEELKVLIFNLIDGLDEENSKLQTELFQKTVVKKKKEKYIEFLLTLNELVDNDNVNDVFEQDENEELSALSENE